MTTNYKQINTVQAMVTAKFWFVSDLTGGAAKAEDQAEK